MTERAFITGITGFAGSHLAEHLEDSGLEVYGTFLTEDSLVNINHLKRVKPFKVDLSKKKKIRRVLSEVKPDYVYHLAAQASPKKSFDNPIETLSTNINCEVNILEAVRVLEIKPKILIVGSADEYGMVRPEENPVNEETEFKPTNPYAVSKITQDMLGLAYKYAYKMDIVRVRPFNHIGSRQARDFAVSTFAEQIAEIEKEKMEPVIRVGDLSAVRDFTAVSDMVRAYKLALEKGENGEVYNIGSGTGTRISEVLDILISLSKQQINVAVDPSRIRPVDIPELVCDCSKFKKKTGWKPLISLPEVLKSVLEYWRTRV